MKQIQKKIFSFLIFTIANISVAQASVTYNVEGIFTEPNAYNTVFTGSFDWDGSALTNLQGVMNSSMAFQEHEPNLSLSNNLITNMDGSVVTASIFLNPSSVVFADGGYDATVHTFPSAPFDTRGFAPSPNPENAYFTFSFDTVGGMLTPVDITTSMEYGDCTAAGMMGSLCMTAFGDATIMVGDRLLGEGTMRGFSSSLTISAVPVPAAVWLFGTALAGLVGVSRKRVLAA